MNSVGLCYQGESANSLSPREEVVVETLEWVVRNPCIHPKNIERELLRLAKLYNIPGADRDC